MTPSTISTATMTILLITKMRSLNSSPVSRVPLASDSTVRRTS